MLKFFKRLLCRHKGKREFIRNIYGGEIITRGYKRSIWQCSICGATVCANHVHADAPEIAAIDANLLKVREAANRAAAKGGQ